MALCIWQKYNAIYIPAEQEPCSMCNGSGTIGGEYYCSKCGRVWVASNDNHGPGSDKTKICSNCLYSDTKTWQGLPCSSCHGGGQSVNRPPSYSRGTYLTSITREIPPGAIMQVFVCNNGYDAAPTWEDITSKVISEGKFFFTNTVKTAEQWGYNIKVCVQRLSAGSACHITSVGGNYE